MSTTATFQPMLNEYLPNKLLREDLLDNDYILKNCLKDDKWRGGRLIVPFEGAYASSVNFGSLTPASEISQYQYVRGHIDEYQEVWGSLIFNQKDIYENQNVRNPQDSFLQMLPGQINQFMNYMRMVTSIMLTAGPHFSLATTDGTAGGTIGVNKIDRFVLGQKIRLDDDNSPPIDLFVTNINLNVPVGANDEGTITVSLTSGGPPVNIAAYTVAQNAKFYFSGVWNGVTASTFVSMKSALLSAANGGSATLHGISKLAFPYLQAINIPGAGINATNILDRLFDGYVTVRRKGRGNASTILMSHKHMGSVMKLIQVSKGAYQVTPTSTNAQLYQWEEVTIMDLSTMRRLTLVGIHEFDDDIIVYWDKESNTFRSNGFFRKRKNPENGNEFYEIRNTSGFQYIVDVSLFGEMEWTKPSTNGIIFGIPNY